MKVLFLCLVSYLALLSPNINAQSEKINCEIVPFETANGDYGTCCVIYKNMSKRNHPAIMEEITKQIMSNRNSEDSSESKKNSSKEIVGDDRIIFDEKEYFKKEQSSVPQPTNKTVIIDDRNIVDAPSVCPEGTMRDHNGGCIEPF